MVKTEGMLEKLAIESIWLHVILTLHSGRWDLRTFEANSLVPCFSVIVLWFQSFHVVTRMKRDSLVCRSHLWWKLFLAFKKVQISIFPTSDFDPSFLTVTRTYGSNSVPNLLVRIRNSSDEHSWFCELFFHNVYTMLWAMIYIFQDFVEKDTGIRPSFCSLPVAVCCLCLWEEKGVDVNTGCLDILGAQLYGLLNWWPVGPFRIATRQVSSTKL